MRSLLLAAAFLSLPASAQTFASVHGGGVDFDLSGTGQTAVFEARLGTFVNRFVAVEGGIGVSRIPEQFGDVTYILPSIEVQLGVPIQDRIRPFLGVGVGTLEPVTDPRPFRRISNGTVLEVDYDPDTRTSLHTSLGIDAGLTPNMLARVTGRLRSTGSDFSSFSGTFAEVTVGLGVRL